LLESIIIANYSDISRNIQSNDPIGIYLSRLSANLFKYRENIRLSNYPNSALHLPRQASNS
jgi:hypothetical protein